MELKIGKKLVEGKLDKAKFIQVFKSTLNLDKAISESIEITYNEIKSSKEEICMSLSAEIDWGYIFSLELDKDIQFRICEIEVKDMVRYKREAVGESYTSIKLEATTLNGIFTIITHNYIKNPEHFYDNWIQNNCYDYVNSKYSEMIFDGGDLNGKG